MGPLNFVQTDVNLHKARVHVKLKQTSRWNWTGNDFLHIHPSPYLFPLSLSYRNLSPQFLSYWRWQPSVVLLFIGRDYVYELLPLTDILFIPHMVYGYGGRWNDIDRGKPTPVPLRLPQIPHGLTRERTRDCAVKGRWLTAWAMARPFHRVVSLK
jgi:hypothetical protein